jgi:hypothetical protein
MTASHLPFDPTFRKTFRDLVLWRRDVRRFRIDRCRTSCSTI